MPDAQTPHGYVVYHPNTDTYIRDLGAVRRLRREWQFVGKLDEATVYAEKCWAEDVAEFLQQKSVSDFAVEVRPVGLVLLGEG